MVLRHVGISLDCLRDVVASDFDAGEVIPYTGRNRVRPTAGRALAYATASRTAAYGGATDYYLMKESGVDVHQEDPYAARRVELEAQFQGLPPAGNGDYWRRVEEAATGQRLPLEVLARCLRERSAAGAFADADRVFSMIMRRIQARVSGWAWSIAAQAKSGMKPQLQQDLVQECYMELWRELTSDVPSFLLEQFSHKIEFIFDHVAQSQMIKAGEWKRPGVDKPTRIPRREIESIHSEPKNDDDPPLSEQLVDAQAQDELNLAEYSDALGEVDNLSRDDRAIINGLFYYDKTQEEIAAELGVTARTIRNRLKRILEYLRRRYQGGEGDNNV